MISQTNEQSLEACIEKAFTIGCLIAVKEPKD
jgi:hypothetical protein